MTIFVSHNLQLHGYVICPTTGSKVIRIEWGEGVVRVVANSPPLVILSSPSSLRLFRPSWVKPFVFTPSHTPSIPLPLSCFCALSLVCCTLSSSSLQIKAEAKKHSDVFGGGDGYDDRFDDYNASKSTPPTSLLWLSCTSSLAYPICIHFHFSCYLFFSCDSLLAIEIASPLLYSLQPAIFTAACLFMKRWLSPTHCLRWIDLIFWM